MKTTYTYKCLNNHIWDEVREVDDRDNCATCMECEMYGKRIFNVPHVRWKGVWPHKDKSDEVDRYYPQLAKYG